MWAVWQDTAFWVTLAALAVIAYPFTLYLAALKLRQWLGRNPWARDPSFTPCVSVIVPVHNDETGIRRKIEELVALDYPKDKLEIIVVSDGSDDGTIPYLNSLRSPIVVLLRTEWEGKQLALNAAVARAKHPFLFFTDVSSFLYPNTIKRLMSNFADPSVGAATTVIRPPKDMYGPYQDPNTIEKSFRDLDAIAGLLESSIASTIGCLGAGYAVRRDAFRPFPPDMCNDFVSALDAVRLGYRAVADAGAFMYLPGSRSVAEEFRRRVRTICQALRTLSGSGVLLTGFGSFFYAWVAWSHKGIRLASPFASVTLALSATKLLFDRFPAILLVTSIFCAGVIFLCLAVPSLRRHALPRALAFFVISQAAALVAWALFLTGRRYARWVPTKRSDDLAESETFGRAIAHKKVS